uniref:Acetylcholinesterase n=1 Tax=Parastrongyloides trichosuri TaxID=131310 RepID=A0A0N4ZD88_PARTI
MHSSEGQIKGTNWVCFNTNLSLFLGVPYAEPPIGDLRFKAPKELNKTILGIFGFAYFGPNYTEVPGNMGLLDQQMALKWIKKNLWQLTNTNSTNITLFGEGAGGASVTAHLFANQSKELFNRVITTSGTIDNRWAISEGEFICSNTESVAFIFNCTPPYNDTDIVTCMQNVTAERLVNESSYIKPLPFLLQWHPALSSSFTPIFNDHLFFGGDLRYKEIRENMKKDADLMIGKVSNESTIFMPIYFNSPPFNCSFDYKPNSKDECNMESVDLYTLFNETLIKVFIPYNLSDGLVNIYNKYVKGNNREKVAHLISDLLFDCDIEKYALRYKNLSTSRNTYFFNYRRNSSFNLWPSWMGIVIYFNSPPFNCSFNYKSGSKDECYMNNVELFDLFNVTLTKLFIPFNLSDGLINIYDKYVKGNKRDKVAHLISDLLFDCDIEKYALRYKNLSTSRNTYFFNYRRNSSFNLWPSWMGIVHGSDLEAEFGLPFKNESIYKEKLEEEKSFSEKLMKMLGDFAKTGNPGDFWKPYDNVTKQALVFDKKVSTRHSQRRENRQRILKGQNNNESDYRFEPFNTTTCEEIDKLALKYYKNLTKDFHAYYIRLKESINGTLFNKESDESEEYKEDDKDDDKDLEGSDEIKDLENNGNETLANYDTNGLRESYNLSGINVSYNESGVYITYNGTEKYDENNDNKDISFYDYESSMNDSLKEEIRKMLPENFEESFYKPNTTTHIDMTTGSKSKGKSKTRTTKQYSRPPR